ncbi:MAG: ferritin-like domain-containing protein [bacterium]|nr:ferritin-like domain-containing protein [bacterium]
MESPPRSQLGSPDSIRAFCLRLLRSGDLETKLTPPLGVDRTDLADTPSGPAVKIDRPVRDAGLRMAGGSDRLPRPGRLHEPEERILCLARFAHHELQAVEYFAWALVRWPELPAALRRGLLSALVDEQRHCRLYLDRLEAHGATFETGDHSDYFWRQAPVIAASPAGPRAFLAAMGLTLEQANLDFSLTYRDGFAAAGDAESAEVCQTVHDEEVAHVALAAHWLARLTNANRRALARAGENPAEKEADDLEAYLEAVPFPLGPARAKGRRFEVAPRRRAGLSEALIEYVRRARSNPERRHGAARTAGGDSGAGPEEKSTT